MDIIAKAHELGSMIAESAEMEAYNKAEIDVQSDEKALVLLNDYKNLQIEVMNAAKENKGDEIIEAIKEKVFSKEEELNTYEITKKLIEAKTNFDRLMHTVNDVMIHAITGEESCSSGSCSSCGGGCK